MSNKYSINLFIKILYLIFKHIFQILPTRKLKEKNIQFYSTDFHTSVYLR